MSLLSDIEDLVDPRNPRSSVDLHHFPHAIEDFPPEVRAEARLILSTPLGSDLQHRVLGVITNAAIVAYGELETVPALRFLSQYPVTPYTYDLSSLISRGERADEAKIRALDKAGFGAIINLCAETPEGDAPLVKQAGLNMQAFHYGIEDGNPPDEATLVQILDQVRDLTAQGIRVYIHCEAGKTRTGVVTAAIRMALQGWTMDQALTEARNFGMSDDMQVRFVQDIGHKLLQNYQDRQAKRPLTFPQLGGYPLLRPGSAQVSAAQLSMTLDNAAASPESKALQ